jgi:phosphotransferase system  glucose/maltose/N-acetylglucosamine-specific IIC component
MEEAFSFQEILPFLIPLLIVQVGLIIVGLIDLSKRQKTRGPKWMWVLIILLGEIWGPIVYFIFGRGEE